MCIGVLRVLEECVKASVVTWLVLSIIHVERGVVDKGKWLILLLAGWD